MFFWLLAWSSRDYFPQFSRLQTVLLRHQPTSGHLLNHALIKCICCWLCRRLLRSTESHRDFHLFPLQNINLLFSLLSSILCHRNEWLERYLLLLWGKAFLFREHKKTLQADTKPAACRPEPSRASTRKPLSPPQPSLRHPWKERGSHFGTEISQW